MLNKKLIVLFFITLTINLFSLGNSEKKIEKKDNFYSFTDSKDREVNIIEEPKRVISLAPSITESLYFLNAEDKLVARTDYCDFPSETKDVDSIGTILTPNIEKIVELNPDLIIASTHFDIETLNKLEEAGLTIIVLVEEGSFEGVYKNIKLLGKILNREDRASQLITSMKKRVESVKSKVKDLEKPVVYYVIGYGEYGEYTAGGDTFISDIIEIAGGENAAKDSKGWSYTLEKIVEKNPDIFICSKYYDSKDGISASIGYKELSAIKNGNIFEIDNNTVDRHGPRVVDGLEAIAKIIHPEAFTIED